MPDSPLPGSGVPLEWSLVGDLVTKHKILLAGGLSYLGSVASA